MGKLKAAEWQKIKQDYISTDISQRGICAKYQVSLSALGKRIKEESWTDLKRQRGQNRIQKEYNVTFSAYSLMDSNCQLILQKIEDGLKETPKEELTASTLKLYTSTMKDVKDIVNYKSKLDIEEQKARIAKLRKEIDDDTHDTVTIKIEGADDYAH